MLAGLESTAIAEILRVSRWGYAVVNATHIFGIALLIGGILPLNLRAFGFWRSVPLPLLARVLVPMAAGGLAIAVLAGLLLFSIRAREYADLGVFQLKLALIVIGTLSSLRLHVGHGLSLKTAGERRLAVHAGISCLCWLGALACGRLIAFYGD